jgi:hypothetical protein
MSEAGMKGRWKEAIGSGKAGQEARRMPKGSARFASAAKRELYVRYSDRENDRLSILSLRNDSVAGGDPR